MKVSNHPLFLLILGLVLMGGAHMTFNIEILAWFASVPFLVYLHQTKGWRSRLWFVMASILAWSIIVFKITTDPIPLLMIPMFSVPIALIQVPGYLIWARFRNRKYAALLFPAILVIMEWLQYTFTPFASWGVAAYTQIDQITLIQSVSLFGMAGLSFLLYWVNAVIGQMIIQRSFDIRKFMLPATVLLIIFSFGSLRYDLSKAKSQQTIKVAAVGTDSKVGNGPMPTDETRRHNAAILFERTRKAAASQATLIVWNEAAAAVFPDEEADWKDALSTLAIETGATLVASYVVPLPGATFYYENKYLLIQPDGSVAETYFKHEPVPGEPSVKGTKPFQTHLLGTSNIGGAICYDYDFPYIARELGKQQADIVAVPSSDWRGIDPIHTKMAALRAIEQGHSIVRSTRFGLSAAINPYGEMVAQMSSFDEHDKIMLGQVPKTKITTLYRLIGDVWVYICMVFVLWFGITNYWYPVNKSKTWH